MSADTQDFSLLMAVWAKDDPLALREALASATVEQTMPPRELVLSIDGPIPEALEAVVRSVEDGEYGPATIVRNTEHGGLAHALQRGVEACTFEVIARADADDINEPTRFEVQIPLMRDLDLLGSAMIDMTTGQRRERPLTSGHIAAYVRDHNPMQHPTVVVRKSALERAGGYRDMPFMEDWYLWYRMIATGARCANVPDALVHYRASHALYERRGGSEPLLSDIRLQRIMLAHGHTSVARAARNVVIRAVYRAVGPRLRRLLYLLLVEKRVRPASVPDM